jgi:hypothetical protein
MMRNPRWKKTVQILWLAIFSYWIGALDAQAISTRYWALLVVYLVGIVGSQYLLLRDVWKPGP